MLQFFTEGDLMGVEKREIMDQIEDVCSLVENMIERDKYYQDQLNVEDLKYVLLRLEQIKKDFK